MSVATSTAAHVRNVTATSASDAPFVVTATIESSITGPVLLVTVDGETRCFDINPHWLRIEERSVVEEATRLLQRHAGYRPASEWQQDEAGTLTAPVAEITGRCRTCAHGCLCELGSKGCGHYGCPAATDATANTCDGAEIHLQARRPKRKRIARRRGTR